jgi:hypothetical protein
VRASVCVRACFLCGCVNVYVTQPKCDRPLEDERSIPFDISCVRACACARARVPFDIHSLLATPPPPLPPFTFAPSPASPLPSTLPPPFPPFPSLPADSLLTSAALSSRRARPGRPIPAPPQARAALPRARRSARRWKALLATPELHRPTATWRTAAAVAVAAAAGRRGRGRRCRWWRRWRAVWVPLGGCTALVRAHTHARASSFNAKSRYSVSGVGRTHAHTRARTCTHARARTRVRMHTSKL